MGLGAKDDIENWFSGEKLGISGWDGKKIDCDL